MTTIGVIGQLFLLLPTHPGCLGQNPESDKMVVCVCVCLCVLLESSNQCRSHCKSEVSG